MKNNMVQNIIEGGNGFGLHVKGSKKAGVVKHTGTLTTTDGSRFKRWGWGNRHFPTVTFTPEDGSDPVVRTSLIPRRNRHTAALHLDDNVIPNGQFPTRIGPDGSAGVYRETTENDEGQARVRIETYSHGSRRDVRRAVLDEIVTNSDGRHSGWVETDTFVLDVREVAKPERNGLALQAAAANLRHRGILGEQGIQYTFHEEGVVNQEPALGNLARRRQAAAEEAARLASEAPAGNPS